jgi:hypothetical protein
VIHCLDVNYKLNFFMTYTIKGERAAKRQRIQEAEEGVGEGVAALEAEICSICRDDLSNLAVITTPCGHRFHRDCLIQWWISSKTCALCRASLETYEFALTVLRHEGTNFIARGHALHVIARCMAAGHQPADVAILYTQARDVLARAGNDFIARCIALQVISRCMTAGHQPADVATLYTRALDILARAGNNFIARCFALLVISRCMAAGHQPADVATLYTQALDVLARAGDNFTARRIANQVIERCIAAGFQVPSVAGL